MNNKNFITTKDKQTADQLKDEGFVLINEESGTWTFLNDRKYSFEKNDKIKITNKLCI